jgi:predicted GNAT superfamily acetyltransferase
VAPRSVDSAAEGPVGDAWKLADRAAERAGVRLHSLVDLEHADQVRDVVHAVWGDQAPPREILRAMQHAGSVLYGARAGAELVGFVWGFGGLADGLHVHSHMLAVLPDWESRGVGYALKLIQRAASLQAGIDEVRWTYDPLASRNARFNLVKLGAVAFRFLPDFYGEMKDRLNRGDRSDRFEVRWRLDSHRARSALSETVRAPYAGLALLEAEGDPESPTPRPTGADPVPGCTVAIPRDHRALRAARPELAAAWRTAAGAWFRRCFERGLVATWITEDGRYVFELPGDS